jgi:hypothetical protein
MQKQADALRLLFIVNDLHTNTFKMVHDLAADDPQFSVKVVASKSIERAYSPLVSSEEISALLNSQQINHQVGITTQEIISWAPDWIFVSRPYNDYAEPHLASGELSQFGKLGHLSYGSNLVQWVNEYHYLRENPFFADASAIFVGSELEFPGEPKFVPVGQLKLDEYIEKKRSTLTFKSPSVAWKPRWTLEGGSSLESHLTSFFKLVATGDFTVVFVMHPLLLRRFELTSQNSLLDKLLSFLSSPRVFTSQGPHFLDSVLGADVFFGDTCSTLAEYAVTQKPKIWNRPPVKTLNGLGKSLLEESLVSESVLDFEDTLYAQLKGGAITSSDNWVESLRLHSPGKRSSAASKVLRHLLSQRH